MKKLLCLTGAMLLVSSAAANAQISLSIGDPQPVYAPGYVVPAPDYPSEHYDRHRHPHNDYWARRQREEHEHDHHDDHRR